MRGMRLAVTLIASAIVIGGVAVGALRLWPPSIEVVEPTDCQGWNTEEFFKKTTARGVSDCLEMGADIRARDTDGITPLFWALDARNQDPDVVVVLLAAGADVNEQVSVGGFTATPLLVAAAKHRGDGVLRVLLDAGADTAFRGGPKGRTALYFAAEREDLEAVSLLLEHGAQANAEDEGGETPLDAVGERFARSRDHHGRIANAIWIIRALLEKGGDSTALAAYGWTEVHTVALLGDNPDELLALVEQGLDPDAETSSGWRASHMAALANEDSRIIATLLGLGVNPNATIGDALTVELRRRLVAAREQYPRRQYPNPDDSRIGDGRTPLHCAAFGNPNPDVIVALIEGGANPNAATITGWTPLHAAVHANPNRDVVEALLEGGAKANSQLRDSWTLSEVFPAGCLAGPDSCARETDLVVTLAEADLPGVKALSTPLHVAVEYPREDSAVGVLIRGGADAMARNVEGETPLHQVETAADAALLMEAGADPNARDEDGYTPLHRAMFRASGTEISALIAALIDGGAAPDARTALGWTPLHTLAMQAKYLEVEVAQSVSILIRRGADPNAQDDYGSTPLHFATNRTTPLHFATSFGTTISDVAKSLIGGGANPNLRNDKGQSPLFNAVDSRCLGAGCDQLAMGIERLVELGADPNLRDETGRTPLHQALSHQALRGQSRESIISALLDAGADATLADENGVTPWDLAQENQALKGTKTYWRLNEARFD